MSKIRKMDVFLLNTIIANILMVFIILKLDIIFIPTLLVGIIATLFYVFVEKFTVIKWTIIMCLNINISFPLLISLKDIVPQYIMYLANFFVLTAVFYSMYKVLINASVKKCKLEKIEIEKNKKTY